MQDGKDIAVPLHEGEPLTQIITNEGKNMNERLVAMEWLDDLTENDPHTPVEIKLPSGRSVVVIWKDGYDSREKLAISYLEQEAPTSDELRSLFARMKSEKPGI